MCWQHSKQAYEDLLNDPTHKPQKCTAKLYPEELLHAIQIAKYESEADKESNMQIYKRYQKLFSEKFGKPIGFANNGNNASNSKNNQNGGTRRNKKIGIKKRKTFRNL